MEFDRAWCAFELVICNSYVHVSGNNHPTSRRELDMFQVLMSTTILNMILKNLITQTQINEMDPKVIFDIPRLSLIEGLIHSPDILDLMAFKWFKKDKSELKSIKTGLTRLKKDELGMLEIMLVGDDQIPLKVYQSDFSGDFSDMAIGAEPENLLDFEHSTIVQDDEARNDIKSLYTRICKIADNLQSGRRAREFVEVMQRTLMMHVEQD